MRDVEYAPDARDDLTEIWDRIAVDSEFYATRYVDRLKAKIRLLATFDSPGRLREDVTRAAVRGHTERSHLILFELTETRLTVLRIIYGARDLNQIRFF